MKTVVLVVDDDAQSRGLCVELVAGPGIEVQAAESATQALALLESRQIDIVLADVQMPGMSGIELLKTVRRDYPEVDMLMMTGFGTIEQAVEAVKLGAYDYITKPFKVDDLKRVFRRLVERQQLAAENRVLREQVKTQDGFGLLVGTSPRMQTIYQMILKVARKRHPVLILGESGTGKELVARAIHTYGPWKDRPFVPVDCGSLTPTLIESELFGHVRGAFTGATQSRAGLLAEAQGGTVFLDEIGELPVELQSRLLRALQEGEIRPLGSNERVALEARVLAATNLNLEDAIHAGTFRKDLYFRLNVISIKLPPLRERKSDIPALAHFFLERHGGAESSITAFSPDVMTRLMSYDWPGNVRELDNCIQRALALGSGPNIEVQDLPSTLLYRVASQSGSGSAAKLEELERKAIVEALEQAGGDRVRAAKILGIGKTTIYRKLKEYGLDAAASVSPSTH